MEREIKLFNEYLSIFDHESFGFKLKYAHSLRVMQIAYEIAISAGLSDEEIYIAELCGLLHDIARFTQWEEFNTFEDADSFDHGDVGEDILKREIDKYTNDDNIKDIVLLSTRYHNKYGVLNSIDENTKKYIFITRDADKIDIIESQGLSIKDDIRLNPNALQSFLNKEIVKNEDSEGSINEILRMMAWIFDFNYPYSINYLKDKKILEEKLKIISPVCDKESISKIRKLINEEMKGR